MVAGLRFAVVGAGPAGLYAVDALLLQDQLPAEVDVFDRLPTPFGLLRYGVAPDHLRMKALARTLQRIVDDERVRFFGNVAVGEDLTVDELRGCYHGVVYAYGAARDRALGIPGEDLPGSASATDFVTWYSGHPDTSAGRFDLGDVGSAVVVGVGNVAVDVARILAKPAAALRQTDIPERVLERLARSAVVDVHVIGRRGPLHASFTSKELRELGDLPDVDVLVDAEQLQLGPEEQRRLAAEPALGRNLDILREWSLRTPTGAARRLHLRFWARPVEAVAGTGGRLAGVRIEPTRLDADGRLVGAGGTELLPAQLLVRSVGYKGTPVPGVPYDDRRHTIPHADGRVLRDGEASPGEYVAGWIGRGPTGVLGTNRSDAEGVVARILEDVVGLRSRAVAAHDVATLLRRRSVGVVDARGWGAINAAEIRLGLAQGRPRSKLGTWDGLLREGAHVSAEDQRAAVLSGKRPAPSGRPSDVPAQEPSR